MNDVYETQCELDERAADFDPLELTPENFRTMMETILANQARMESEIERLEQWMIRVDRDLNQMARNQRRILYEIAVRSREDGEFMETDRIERLLRDVPPHY